jgi:hypothetical protein
MICFYEMLVGLTPMLGGTRVVHQSKPQRESRPTFSAAIARAAHQALSVLEEAHECAWDGSCDDWQFAVELPVLLNAGTTVTALRALIESGQIEHAQETTAPSHSLRRFRRVNSLAFPPHTCFVLRRIETPTSTSESMIGERLSTPPGGGAALASPKKTLVPNWDSRLKELRLGKKLVKRFTHRATAQQLILGAFQEEGWPEAIDDPLPVQPGVNPQRRLHHTVRNLNSAQRPPTIRFFINGGGELIRWHLVRPSRATSAQSARVRR